MSLRLRMATYASVHGPSRCSPPSSSPPPSPFPPRRPPRPRLKTKVDSPQQRWGQAARETPPSLCAPRLGRAVDDTPVLPLGGVERVRLELGLDHVHGVDAVVSALISAVRGYQDLRSPEGKACCCAVRHCPQWRDLVPLDAVHPDMALDEPLVGEEVRSVVRVDRPRGMLPRRRHEPHRSQLTRNPLRLAAPSPSAP